MVLNYISKGVTRIFGSRNDRMLKAYHRRAAAVTAIEPQILPLSDTQLREKVVEFRRRIREGEKPASLTTQALAVAREVMDRAVGIRSIFKPENKFDAAKLPAELQGVFQETYEKAQSLAPVLVRGGGEVGVPGWMQVEIPHALYDAVRAIYPQSRPPFRARPFDVQLIGGMVLSEGHISEMKTGEGKTIVAPLACFLASLEGMQSHVVTTNDYLVQRDRDWVFPFYYHLGMTVGAIHPYHMQSQEMKQQAYFCDVVYGTNAEFGFDYLRDNMKMTSAEQVQKKREFCIVDEVDSILIDEARTPLIISGPAHEDAPRYELADQLSRHLIQKQREWDAASEGVENAKRRIKGLEGDIRNTADKTAIPAMREESRRLKEQLPELEEARDRHTQYYEVERDRKAVYLTHDGTTEAQKIANIGSFYVGNNMDLPHLLENSLRAHVVYQRDKDYVVQNGEVIIVDEFTGRLMIGRQWSDGLHQAVEAKEKVKVKQETQTLATITIQNFFKLYKRLAGMTGTAMTEAHEFNEIYKLDAVAIPTNLPCVRRDLDDVIFVNEKDKWQNITDEIRRMNDIGRPVLVGTTSVEHSEMLSSLLTRKHGIKHEVLNAKQHEREAQIILHAGEQGAVMIATNMAGRGTDIKLQPIDRASLVRHWQLRNLLPREAKPEMDDARIIALAYRHMAKIQLGLKAGQAEALTEADARLQLARKWVAEFTLTDPDKAAKMDLAQCEAALDAVPCFEFHKLRVYTHVEEMGGLHIVGTERHESRRIDNQLRGRAGRQGDQGSSRFFISLEDDLMKLFANKAVLTALSKLGMKEGVAIEHRWITRSIEKAQRKVEERNFEIRKQLLEYDEVANYQRGYFYKLRQDVLEGQGIEELIFDYIADAVEDSVVSFLDRDYVPSQVAAWCVENLDVAIEAYKLRENDLESLKDLVSRSARDEISQTIELTIGEYMSDELPREEWDLRGLSQWAMSRFSVDLKQNQLRQMNPTEVKNRLTEAAHEQLDRKDLSGLEPFLDKLYPQRQIARWAGMKFNVELDPAELKALDREDVTPFIVQKAKAAYRRREIEYPIDYILQTAFAVAQQGGGDVAGQLTAWANHRFELGWHPEDVLKIPASELREKLLAEQVSWMTGDRLEKLVDQAIATQGGNPSALVEWAEQRFLQTFSADEVKTPELARKALLAKGRNLYRYELTQLERFVLLSILDQAWKDHLYVMDHLRSAVSLRAYAEQDPRIVYKREGADRFNDMLRGVRDRVTDLIFRAQLSSNAEVRSVYNAQQAEHAEAAGTIASAHSTDEPGEGVAAGEEGPLMSRHQRRAAAASRSKDDRGTGRNRGKDRKRGR